MAWHLLVLNLALTLGMLATGFLAEAFSRAGIGSVGIVGFASVALLIPLALLILEIHPRGYWV